MSGSPALRIDAHHHLWALGRHDLSWLEAPELGPIRRDFGLADLAAAVAGQQVGQTVVVQTIASVAETVDLLAVAAASELVAGVVGWVDLTADAVGEELAALRERPDGAGLVGIRHLVQSEPDPDWLARPDVLRGLGQIAAAGLVYDLLTLPPQLPAALRAVVDVPELTFVLDHLSKPPIASGEREPWETRIRALATRDNVVCKLSGMVTEADRASWSVDDLRPYAEVVLDAFGPDRVMFGSDWPVCTLAATYEQVLEAAETLTAGLTPVEREAVFSGTARRIYGLP
jgi:L-fuconolactonase